VEQEEFAVKRFWIWLKYSDFDVIAIGDFKEELGLESVKELDDRRVNFVKVL
jgi:hypothetical protein